MVEGGTLTIEEADEKRRVAPVRYATALVGPERADDLVAEGFASVLARGADKWAAIFDSPVATCTELS